MRNKKHFTLVEIMIVVAIIGLLAAIAIPSFIKARENSQKSTCINNLRQIDGAQQQAMLDGNATLTDAVVLEYLHAEASTSITCPTNKNEYDLDTTIPPVCPDTVTGHALP